MTMIKFNRITLKEDNRIKLKPTNPHIRKRRMMDIMVKCQVKTLVMLGHQPNQ
jgi:hypothetical protein